MMYVPAFTPRPVLSDSATSEQRLDVLDRFVANIGTYTLTDSTVTFTPSVAKNPGVMSGRTFKWTVRVAADSLWINSTVHLVRLE
jgi:hypothetical protein